MLSETSSQDLTEKWKAMVEEGNDSYAQGKIPEAEVKFLAALEEAEKFGEDDPRLALTLNNLAAMYHEQGKYTMAEPLYKRALDLRIRIHGELHADIALNHHNLALLYSARRMYPPAETHYKTALAMKEELYGKDAPELLNTLQYYAQLMKVLNRPVDKQLIESRAKNIAARIAPPAAAEIAPPKAAETVPSGVSENPPPKAAETAPARISENPPETAAQPEESQVP